MLVYYDLNLTNVFVFFLGIKVCLPGGMVSEDEDKSIAQTCLREMEEEIGIGHNQAPAPKPEPALEPAPAPAPKPEPVVEAKKEEGEIRFCV